MMQDSAADSEGELVHYAPNLIQSVLRVMQEPKWVSAVEVELSSIEKNERWELVICLMERNL